MRLIYADELRNEVDNYDFSEYSDYSNMIDMIDDAPTVEAEPKKRGKWEFHANFVGNYYTCTVCKNVAREMPECMGEPIYEFCPYCGARMKGSDTNETD